MKKRIVLAGALGLTLALGLALAGCGSTETTTGTAASVAETEASSPAEETQKTETKEDSSSAEAETPKQEQPDTPDFPELEEGEQLGMIQSIDTENNQITLLVMNTDIAKDENFDPENMPEGEDFDPSNMPKGEDFDPSNMPNGGNFDPGNKPDDENFDPSNMPEEFNSENMPERPESSDSDAGQFAGQAPGGNPFAGQAETYTLSVNTVMTDADGASILFTDLKENDAVIFTEEDGVLNTITVTEFNLEKTENQQSS